MTPFLTIFTPAYNRAYTLPRTYESLKNQKCKDFIWLVVDDGSTDNTAELIKKWQKEDNGIEIRYIYKENGGMHTAHNTAYDNIDTELNICIDSDDALAENAVELIKNKWDSIDKKEYAGIIGLDADFDNNILGNKYPEEIEFLTLERDKQICINGDKKIVLRTDIVNNYPRYPVFQKENFVPLSTLYAMILRENKLLVINDVLCNVEYMTDGSTKNMLRQYFKNPNGFRYSRLVNMTERDSLKKILILYTHYIAESLLAKKPIIKDAKNKPLALMCYPMGLGLYFYIILKNKNK